MAYPAQLGTTPPYQLITVITYAVIALNTTAQCVTICNKHCCFELRTAFNSCQRGHQTANSYEAPTLPPNNALTFQILQSLHGIWSKWVVGMPFLCRVDKRDFGQDPNMCYPDNWADPNLAVKYYCIKQAWNSGCEAVTPGAIAAFTAGLQQCFSTALQLFDEVLIAPHLDPIGDTSKRPKWRNMLRFDPLEKDANG